MRRSVVLLATMLLVSTAVFAGSNLTPTNYGEMEPVQFNHTEHAERVGCPNCHHSSGAEHRCGYCHRPKARNGAPALEQAAHREGAGKCWACHLKEKAIHPLECEACHRG